MEFIQNIFHQTYFNYHPKQMVDILLVTYIIYRLLKLIHGTRAWRILGGLVIFVCALLLSDKLGLNTLHWLLDKATMFAPFAIVILLLPELRATLEELYKIGQWPQRFLQKKTSANQQTIDEIALAVLEMSASKTGAIIVLVNKNQLDFLIPTGTVLNATVSNHLLRSIFYGENPLHDGAVLLDGNRVLAAGCTLPLSESNNLGAKFHMRHRAAMGISEQSDAVAIVVSEEKGTISLFQSGEHSIIKDINVLKDILAKHLIDDEKQVSIKTKLRIKG